MTIKSMTGFSRSDGACGETRFHWEARSVNGRGLELRLRLPPGFESLEIKARGLCQEKLNRGNCTINLAIKRETGQFELKLNEAALRQAMAIAERAREIADLKHARLDTLLGMRGVVEAVEGEDNEETQARLAEALLVGLKTALDELVAARSAEGARLAEVIAGQLDQIAKFTERAANAEARQPEAVRAKLAEQLRRVVENSAGLDAERLHQEALLIATKADIQEELDRLRAHIAAARDLLAEDQPVGRKFDFLAQEFNREANTICSKAADIEVSRAGMELKTVVDQLREQVQNIE
jgi:uncharacterized protein (TIGR00255 family)